MKIVGYILAVAGSAVLIFASYKKLIPISLSEAIGFVSGALCVWLTVKENIWNWPVGIVNNIAFAILFFKTALFADMGLQIIYLGLGIYGWYQWLYGGKSRSPLTISAIKPVQAIVLTVLTVLSTAILTKYLVSVHDSAPLWDALTTVMSLVAQYLLTKKILENWFVWISADVVYIALYLYKELSLTAILYFIFMVMCVIGVKEWRATLLRLSSRVSSQQELPA